MKNLIITLSLIVLVGPVHSQSIKKEDILPFVQGGSLTYNINVALGQIDWGEDQKKLSARIATLEKDLEKKPDPSLAFELFDAWSREESSRDISLTAKKLYKIFSSKEKGEDYTLARIEAGLRSNDKNLKDSSWKELVPLLEKGTSPRGYQMGIWFKRNELDFNTAMGIANVFKQAHPENAESWYTYAETLFGANILGMLGQIFEFAKQTTTGDQAAQGKEFIDVLLKLTNENLDFPGLDKAIALSPNNYKYLVGSAMFKSLAVFYTQMLTAAQTPDFDPQFFNEFFKSRDEAVFGPIADYLDRAKKLRPPRDIQVFLASALYHCAFGRFKVAEEEVQTALKIRPDLSSPYNALIYTQIIPVINFGNPDLNLLGSIAEKVLLAKSKAGLLNCDDLGTLFSIHIRRYYKPLDGKKPDPENLTKALAYSDQAQKLDKDLFISKLLAAWSLVINEKYKDAKIAFETGLVQAQKNEEKASMKLGLAVCFWTMGNIPIARQNAQEAFDLDPSLERAKLFLETVKAK